MPWTIEAALEDDVVKNVRRLPGEYQFQVGELQTTITIKLRPSKVRGGFEYSQSHFIHTPVQGSAYATSRPWGDDEAYALHLAISGITDYYRHAVKAGHKPTESWLVPNEHFR